MKGIVFTEFVEMVEQRYSPELADQMIEASALSSGGAYTSVGDYHHQELLAMVGTLVSLTGEKQADLVRHFGHHLFGSFSRLYPSFFVGAQSSLDFLQGIEDIIHAEVKKLYPDVELPRFDVDRPARSRLVLTYHSHRHMGDLAHGLIEGCIAHFGEALALIREDLPGNEGIVRFTIGV